MLPYKATASCGSWGLSRLPPELFTFNLQQWYIYRPELRSDCNCMLLCEVLPNGYLALAIQCHYNAVLPYTIDIDQLLMSTILN